MLFIFYVSNKFGKLCPPNLCKNIYIIKPLKHSNTNYIDSLRYFKINIIPQFLEFTVNILSFCLFVYL